LPALRHLADSIAWGGARVFPTTQARLSTSQRISVFQHDQDPGSSDNRPANFVHGATGASFNHVSLAGSVSPFSSAAIGADFRASARHPLIELGS
jgi:hypothetical protein